MFFAVLSFSKIYTDDTIISEQIKAGQTFIIETQSDLYNHTIVIPELDDIDVRYTQGSNSLGMAMKGSNSNGIVGYGQNPVKAVITAKKNITLSAYVSFYTKYESSPEMVIYTDSQFTKTFENPKTNTIVAGFFPGSVFVTITSQRRSQSNGYFSLVSHSSTTASSMPVSIVRASNTTTVSIKVQPYSKIMLGKPHSATVKGNKNGAVFSFVPIVIHTITGSISTKLPTIPYTRPNTRPNTHKADIHISSRNHNFTSIWINLFFGIGMAILIYAIVSAIIKCRKHSQDVAAIPPILGDDVQPLSSPYQAPPPDTIKPQQYQAPYPAARPIIVYPQVRAAYPTV